MSISVDCVAGAPLADVNDAAEPLTKVPPSRRTVARADSKTAPEPR